MNLDNELYKLNSLKSITTNQNKLVAWFLDKKIQSNRKQSLNEGFKKGISPTGELLNKFYTVRPCP